MIAIGARALITHLQGVPYHTAQTLPRMQGVWPQFTIDRGASRQSIGNSVIGWATSCDRNNDRPSHSKDYHQVFWPYPATTKSYPPEL